ncbi:hypothetical protein ACFQ9Z_33095 [Streptomyces sp. NPDC056580]|uniref:hypothetical protein n=1 Tax=Streptomyces sp. NPDC056580 TaxID=3345872 RepID=UPI0036A3C9FA
MGRCSHVAVSALPRGSQLVGTARARRARASSPAIGNRVHRRPAARRARCASAPAPSPGGTGVQGVREVHAQFGVTETDNAKYQAECSHDTEKASPGSYAVTLKTGIRAELTATERPTTGSTPSSPTTSW